MSESRSQSQQSQSTGAILRQNTGGEKQSPGMDRNGLEGGGPALEYLGHIQRAAGNSGVAALWKSGALQRQLGIQRQLTVGAADDPLELEADEVADRVMRMAGPGADEEAHTAQMQRAPLQISRLGGESEEELQYKLQRECAKCEEEQIQQSPAISRMGDDEELKPKALQRNLAGMDGDAGESLGYTHAFEKNDDEEDLGTTTSMYMQREANASSNAGGPVGPDLANRIGALRRGSGQALPDSERSFFEPRFNQDFGNIRIHTGSEAASVARAVNARAFTIGRDVVFGAGEYRPGTDDGRRLMAHELTHTVQQGATASKVAAKTVVRREALPVVQRQGRPGARMRQVRILSGGDKATAGQVRVLDSEGVYRQTVAIKNGMARVEAAMGDSLVVLANFKAELYGKTVEVGDSDTVSVQIERADLGPQAVKPVSISIDETKAAVDGKPYAKEDLVKLLFEEKGRTLSLGKGGTLTLNFDPPIAYESGVRTLSFLNYKPGEDYEITLANSTSGADLKMGKGSNLSSPNGSAPQNRGVSGRYGQKPRYFRQIIIKDVVDPKVKHADAPNYPGLDVQNMSAQTSGRIDAITILLDMSGSMLREEAAGDETVADVEAMGDQMRGQKGPERTALYQKAANAIRKRFLPMASMEIPVSFNGFFFDPEKKTTRLESFTPNAETNKDKPPRPVPGFEPGTLNQARFAALNEACKSRQFQDYTPLASAFQGGVAKANTIAPDATNQLFILITDGVGSAVGEADGQSVALQETLKDLQNQSAELSFGRNRRAFLELIGYKIPIEERAEVLKFVLPGWTTSTYDANNTQMLESILLGIRAKYELPRNTTSRGEEERHFIPNRSVTGFETLQDYCAELKKDFPYAIGDDRKKDKERETIRPSRLPGSGSRNLAIEPRTTPEGQRLRRTPQVAQERSESPASPVAAAEPALLERAADIGATSVRRQVSPFEFGPGEFDHLHPGPSVADPVTRAALLAPFSGLARTLLDHYLVGRGVPLLLTESQVQELDAVVHPIEHTEDFAEATMEMQEQWETTREPVIRQIVTKGSGFARAPNTLGQFSVFYQGRLIVDRTGATFFEGRMRLYDHYNFDFDLEKNRSYSGHFKTAVGSTFPGEAYDAHTAWRPTRYTTLGDKSIKPEY